MLSGCAVKLPKVKVPVGDGPLPSSEPAVSRPALPVESQEAVQPEADTIRPDTEEEYQALPRKFMLSDDGRIGQRLEVYEKKLLDWHMLDEQIATMDLDGERPSGWYACPGIYGEASLVRRNICGKRSSPER